MSVPRAYPMKHANTCTQSADCFRLVSAKSGERIEIVKELPDWSDCYCSAYENPFGSYLVALGRASNMSRKVSSRPMGKTPEAANVWPAPNPPSFAHESWCYLVNV